MSDTVCSIVLYGHSEREIAPLATSLLASEQLERLVFVDNGGCDWANGWVGDRVSYIRPAGNIGFGAGHNLALKHFGQNARYYIVCNPDISLDPSCLGILAREIERLNVGLVVPDVRYLNGDRQEVCKLLPSPLNLFVRRFAPKLADVFDNSYLMRGADYSHPLFAPFLSGCFMFFRGDALRSVRGFDERYFMYMEDVDLSRQVAERFGAMYTPAVQVAHAFQRGSYANRKLLNYHITSAIRYFNKWGWFFDVKRWRLNGIARSQFTDN